MDANYWSNIQASNRGGVPVANVVDFNQSGIMPYSGVEVIPAASLELIMNQQRLAGVSGLHVDYKYIIYCIKYSMKLLQCWDGAVHMM